MGSRPGPDEGWQWEPLVRSVGEGQGKGSAGELNTVFFSSGLVQLLVI